VAIDHRAVVERHRCQFQSSFGKDQPAPVVARRPDDAVRIETAICVAWVEEVAGAAAGDAGDSAA